MKLDSIFVRYTCFIRKQNLGQKLSTFGCWSIGVYENWVLFDRQFYKWMFTWFHICHYFYLENALRFCAIWKILRILVSKLALGNKIWAKNFLNAGVDRLVYMKFWVLFDCEDLKAECTVGKSPERECEICSLLFFQTSISFQSLSYRYRRRDKVCAKEKAEYSNFSVRV